MGVNVKQGKPEKLAAKKAYVMKKGTTCANAQTVMKRKQKIPNQPQQRKQAVKPVNVSDADAGTSTISQRDYERRVVLATKELKLTRRLAENDPKTRRHAIKTLQNWFLARDKLEPFSENDFMIIWKGLYYSMWMSDKPLEQEECAERIAKLTKSLSTRSALLYFRAGLATLVNEWFGIDQLRLDKFLMFVRRLLRSALFTLVDSSFEAGDVKLFQAAFMDTLMRSTAARISTGLQIHFVDIYLEEVAKVTRGELTSKQAQRFVNPFVEVIYTCMDGRLLGQVAKSVFRHLMRQSDVGQEYSEKYAHWRQTGFRGGDINCMVQDEETDSNEGSEDSGDDQKPLQNGVTNGSDVLDPRAGRVDVMLPQIPFDAATLANTLRNSKFREQSKANNRRCVKKLITEFEALAQSKYPLAVGPVELPTKERRVQRNAAERLRQFEAELYADSNRNQLRTRKRRKAGADGAGDGEHNVSTFADDESDGCDDDDDTEERTSGLRAPKRMKVLQQRTVAEKRDGVKSVERTMKATKNVPSTDKKLSKSKAYSKISFPFRKIYEHKFKRTCGTWYVFNMSDETKNVRHLPTKKPVTSSPSTPTKQPSIPECTSPSRNSSPQTTINVEKVVGKLPSPSPSSPQLSGTMVTEIGGPSDEYDGEPTQESASPSIFKINVFSPDADGFVDFVVARQLAVQSANESLRKEATPPRKESSKMSLTPISEKRVKIALNLNRSQDVDEHVRQIIASPAIPFDANRKPAKPLLKKRISMGTPINPFKVKSSSRRRKSLQ